MSQSAVSLQSVRLAWPGRVIVPEIVGQFEQGSLTAIVGPNGAGKSTLIKALSGRIKPARGRIIFNPDLGRPACMPQKSELDLSVPITCYELVAMGAWHRFGPWRGLSVQDHQGIRAALQKVGLTGFERHPIDGLSGGQLQRALFARLIVREAQIILLDEPFAAVDLATTQDLLRLLLNWHKQGRTIVAVLHDLEMVRKYFPQSLLLARQVVAWGPTEQALTAANLHLARHLGEQAA